MAFWEQILCRYILLLDYQQMRIEASATKRICEKYFLTLLEAFTPKNIYWGWENCWSRKVLVKYPIVGICKYSNELFGNKLYNLKPDCLTRMSSDQMNFLYVGDTSTYSVAIISTRFYIKVKKICWKWFV